MIKCAKKEERERVTIAVDFWWESGGVVWRGFADKGAITHLLLP